jgi:hypothetical protein
MTTVAEAIAALEKPERGKREPNDQATCKWLDWMPTQQSIPIIICDTDESPLDIPQVWGEHREAKQLQGRY